MTQTVVPGGIADVLHSADASNADLGLALAVGLGGRGAA